MANNNIGYRAIYKLETASDFKLLNDELQAIWIKIMGGLTDKDMTSTTWGTITYIRALTDSINNKITAIEKLNTEQNNRLKTLEEYKDKAETRIAALEEKVTALEARVATLEGGSTT